MQLARAVVVVMMILSVAGRAAADDEPPRPQPELRPYVVALSFGVGDLHVDQTKAGCAACSETPPALDTYFMVGARLTPRFALGVQVYVQAQFIDGHPNDDTREVALEAFGFGQATITPDIQLVAGLGYANLEYEFSVEHQGVFGTVSEDETEHIGAGVATLVAARFRVNQTRGWDLGIEGRVTTLFLGSAGTVNGFSVDLVGGHF